MTGSLPNDAKERKAAPMAEGLLWYFPNALAEVARVSKAGNDQHNPGQPMHHARGKSSDHADCILRHLVDAGTRDTDGMRHSAKVAWRALALLQEELEREEGVPLPRNAQPPVVYGELIPHEKAKAAMRDGVVFERVEDFVITGDSPPPPFLDDDEGRIPAEPPREHAA